MRRPEDRPGNVIVFVPKPDLERARLIREAHAIYESIFPTQVPDDGVAEQADSESCEM